jgi:TRAP-type C4-dicarboxylate transport system substrate-binding protein
MVREFTQAATLAAAVVFGFTAPALSQEKRTFKISQVFPATYFQYVEGIKKFTDAVEAASGGKIKFQTYHAGQLGKETTSIVSSGLAEFGLLVPSYEPARLPLTSLVELPGLHSTACEGSARYWSLAKEGGALYEAEYKPLGLRPLYVILQSPYRVVTSKKRVGSLDDVAGLKIRASGAAMDKTIRALGATPIRVTGPELYDSLSRGTVDGALWPMGSTKTYGLEDIFRYVADGSQLGSAAVFFAISEQVWQGLDEETKKIMSDAGEEVNKSLCKYTDKHEAEATEELVAAGRLQVVKLSNDEIARWNDRVSPIVEAWVNEMDSTGRPGTALLQAYRQKAAN